MNRNLLFLIIVLMPLFIASVAFAACTDSDNGINYYVKGTCYDNNYLNGVTDLCSDKYGNTKDIPGDTTQYIVEYYCQADACVWSGTPVLCPNGCSDGACVIQYTCYDQDEGKNYYVKGSAEGILGGTNCLAGTTAGKTVCPGDYVQLQDKCNDYNTNNLDELYCDNNKVMTIGTTCQNGCKSGACCKKQACQQYTCEELKTGQKSYFDGCQNSGFDRVCFNKYTAIYQGCGKSTGSDGCTVNNVNAAQNILCTISSSCTDSDGGNNYYVKGTAIDSNGPNTDYCEVSSTSGQYYLVEYYCQDSIALGHFIQCPNNYRCSDGACVRNPGTSSASQIDIATVGTACELSGGYCIAASESCINGYAISSSGCTGTNKCCSKQMSTDDLLSIQMAFESIRVEMDRLQRSSINISNYYNSVGDSTRAAKFSDIANMFQTAISKIDNIISKIDTNRNNPSQMREQLKTDTADLKVYTGSITQALAGQTTSPVTTTTASSGTTCESIIDNGPNTIKLIIVSDGYIDYGVFDADVTDFVQNWFLKVEPYKSYSNFFSIYKLKGNFSLGCGYYEGNPKYNCTPETVIKLADYCPSKSKQTDFLVMVGDPEAHPGTCINYYYNDTVLPNFPFPLVRNSMMSHSRTGEHALHEYTHCYGIQDEYLAYFDFFPTDEYLTSTVNCDKKGCPKWCSGIINTSNPCYNAVQEFQKCILNNSYLDCINRSSDIEKYILTCNVGVNCNGGVGCFYGCGSTNGYRELKYSLMGIAYDAGDRYYLSPNTKNQIIKIIGERVVSNYICESECTNGQRICSGNGYKTCGNFDSDSCTEWSNVTNCSTGQTCNNGVCIQTSLETSKLACTINPETGKNSTCICIVNENKNKFTVILKKNGILDNNLIRQKLNSFLDSVRNDIGLENVGISYFEGSTISQLDQFVENLYYQKDVGYAIIIGDDLAPDLDINKIDEILALVGRLRNLPDGQLNPDAECKDIAFSWILQPTLLTDEQDIAFIGKVIDTYTKYHNNENNILSSYLDKQLHIRWDSKIDDNSSHLGSEPPPNYQKEVLIVLNTEHEKVANELKKKYYLLSYHVHGSETQVSIGLKGQPEEDIYPVWTTLNEFSAFTQQYGTPFLLLDDWACQTTLVKYDDIQNCCWPQTFIGAGIWAAYHLGGDGNEIQKTKIAFSNGPFFGYAIRHNPGGQHLIFGDITSHFRTQTCTNECTSGQKMCSGNGYKTCTMQGSCLKWSAVTNCATGYTCSNGQCVSIAMPNTASCTDTDGGRNYYVKGSITTSYGTGWDYCFVSLSSGGSNTTGQWLAEFYCTEAGSNRDLIECQCQNGVCVTNTTSCFNECTAGQKACVGNGYKTCGNYDTDSCLEWSNITNCPSGQTCRDGACINQTSQPNLTIISAMFETKNIVINTEWGIDLTIRNSGSLDKFGTVRCRLIKPDMIALDIESSCLRMPAGSTTEFYHPRRPGCYPDILGVWNVTSCTVYGTSKPDCYDRVPENTRSNLGTFTVVPSGWWCVDSDVTAEFPDGKNYYTRGWYKQCYNDSCQLERSDTCLDSYRLREGYCENNMLKEEFNVSCPNGCKDGACIIKIYKKGIVYEYGGNNQLTNTDDKATCTSPDMCVHNGICYQYHGTCSDADNDGDLEFCGKYYVDPLATQHGNNSWWFEVDSFGKGLSGYPASYSYACDLCFGQGKWNIGGEVGSTKDDPNGWDHCCGDDAGEYLITTNGKSACCDSLTDQVDNNGNCFAPTQTTIYKKGIFYEQGGSNQLTNANDKKTCPADNMCVHDNQCYDYHGACSDADNDGDMEMCGRNFNSWAAEYGSNGWWIETDSFGKGLDGYPGAYSFACDLCDGSGWNLGGDAVSAKNDANGWDHCCGDDTGEYYRNTNGNVACCDSLSDIVNSNGNCVTAGTTMPNTATCTDTDGGRNYYVKGLVTTPSGSGWDYCFVSLSSGGSNTTGQWLAEFYCTEAGSNRDLIECQCQNGACV